MLIRRRTSVIATANAEVTIFQVADWIGMNVPETSASLKTYCPFGEVSHSDGGTDTAFRFYRDTNSAYCFAGCGAFTPVRLAALAWDRGFKDVAEELLERIGHRPLDPAEAWEAAATYVAPVDLEALGSALKLYAERVEPRWQTRQYDEEVQQVLGRCFALLGSVRSGDDAARWLTVCKTVMGRALRR